MAHRRQELGLRLIGAQRFDTRAAKLLRQGDELAITLFAFGLEHFHQGDAGAHARILILVGDDEAVEQC